MIYILVESLMLTQSSHCFCINLLQTFSYRIADVTGANKGLGFAISKQLASNGVKVILTARDV